MVTEVLTAAYFAVGLLVFHKSLMYFDRRNGDSDPEGIDALVSLGLACFWPATILFYSIYKLFRG